MPPSCLAVRTDLGIDDDFIMDDSECVFEDRVDTLADNNVQQNTSIDERIKNMSPQILDNMNQTGPQMGLDER